MNEDTTHYNFTTVLILQKLQNYALITQINFYRTFQTPLGVLKEYKIFISLRFITCRKMTEDTMVLQTYSAKG